MELQIKVRQGELSGQVQAYVGKKFHRFDRYLPSIHTVEVEVARERTRASQQRFMVEATLEVNGTLTRAEDRAADAFTAIDATRDHLRKQIERYKGKVYFERRRSGQISRARDRSSPTEPPIEAEAPAEPPDLVVRAKSFEMKSMSGNEAIEQMELLGHDFFFFYNFDTRQYNVLYRRKAGGYGLIEPTLTER